MIVRCGGRHVNRIGGSWLRAHGRALLLATAAVSGIAGARSNGPVTIAGVDQTKAEELVAAAHKICPYSNAIRGNVDVGFTVSARERKS